MSHPSPIRWSIPALALTLALTACPSASQPLAPAQEATGEISGTVRSSDTLADSAVIPGEIIIKFKPGLRPQGLSSLSVGGTRLEAQGSLSTLGTRLYQANTDAAGTLELVQALEARNDVEYAVPNRTLHALRAPNDPGFAAQWHYAAMNLPKAWDISIGSSSTVVAVVDTGVLAHPDLTPRLLPGFDFVSAKNNPGDGDGRDNNPTDEGTNETSGYHGLHVAGTIGAATDNNSVAAGVNWAAKIVPVRGLGAGGGGSSLDIFAGIAWAGGLPVAGVPANTNPASVINLSLGGPGTCSSFEQDIINTLAARGVIVVVAAGNDNVNASSFTPANCQNVITVGATGFSGTRAPYSNFGSRVDVMAPGGNTQETFAFQGQSVPAGVVSLGRNDATGRFGVNILQGTSMAAPHVAGLVSLMKALKPDLTVGQALGVLKKTARALSAAQCVRPTASDCGAGLVDAAAALNAVKTGDIPAPTPIPTPVPTPSPDPSSIVVVACFVSGNTCDPLRSGSTESSTLGAYTVDGLVAGSYRMAAFEDRNGNGRFDTGEPFGENGKPVQLSAGQRLTEVNVNIAAGQANPAWLSTVSR